jgi:chromosome segregation ATPase
MDNYYKKKADKYKYKYLKLKNRIEYIGGGGDEDEFILGKEFESSYNECIEECKKNNNVYSLVYATGYKSDKLKKCIKDCQNKVSELSKENFKQKLIARKIEEEKEKENQVKIKQKNLKKRETREINEYNETTDNKISNIEELREIQKNIQEKNRIYDENKKAIDNRIAKAEYERIKSTIVTPFDF